MNAECVTACMQSKLTGSPSCVLSRIWPDDNKLYMHKCICQNISIFVVMRNLINVQNIESKNLILGIGRALYTFAIHMHL